jgi:hypothetical protein
MVVGQSGGFRRLTTQIATAREKGNEWDGFFCFLWSIEMKRKPFMNEKKENRNEWY